MGTDLHARHDHLLQVSVPLLPIQHIAPNLYGQKGYEKESQSQDSTILQ
jgi:hypothetical protein